MVESLSAKEFIELLELKDVIEELSINMYEDCKMSEYDSYHDEKWWKKMNDFADCKSQIQFVKKEKNLL